MRLVPKPTVLEAFFAKWKKIGNYNESCNNMRSYIMDIKLIHYSKSKKESKEQESIQSSTTPDPGMARIPMGK